MISDESSEDEPKRPLLGETRRAAFGVIVR